MKKKSANPTRSYLFIDLILLILSFYIVLDWFPLSTRIPFEKYSIPAIFYAIVWIICSYLFGRYRSLKKQKYFISTLRLLDVCLVVLLIFKALIYFYFENYSSNVLITIVIGTFLLNYLFLSLFFAYRYAVDYNEVFFDPVQERADAKVKVSNELDNESYIQLCKIIRNHTSSSTLGFFQDNFNLKGGNTMVYISTDSENLQMTPNYQYSTIIQLERLNNLRGINRTLSIVNEKLPDNGVFVCCFETKSTYKKRILNKYPKRLNYIIYSFDYLFRRILPKIVLTRKLFFLLSSGKNRIFSKAEVLGRLYCLGYDVFREKKIDGLNYIFARRVKQPVSYQKKIYGPLIRLHRFGKDGKPFEVFKMRTMHPYSEYLQGYIYERNNLQDGGKFNKDFRITTLGRFMRKYWVDELPMFINLLKGEMKLVGVRPLSAQYFSLYSKELQELRGHYKPGLLPPFYADMPRTLPEIEASEMTYLKECKYKGVIITDIRYLFKILMNILVKKARSA
jgi:lipopolysaccharide/colanic/teichoic acid biosynthesis glycosyltransferase